MKRSHHVLAVLSVASAAVAGSTVRAGEKDADVRVPEPAKAAACWPSDWCAWYADDLGEFYKDKQNPWISKFELGGRFHYQYGHVSGEDVRGNSFDHTFQEFRRARLEAKVDFLRFFDAEVGVNWVDDGRYRALPPNEMDWAYDTFDSAVLGFDIGEAFGTGPLDKIKLEYGRMKLRMSEEVHTSSNNLLAVERAAISDKLGGEQTRPTGATLELRKGDWTAVMGVFSNEDDSDFLANWDDGLIYYGSLTWQLNDSWMLRLEHAHGDRKGMDDVLGYDHATSLAAIYEVKPWGVMANVMYGENSDDPLANPLREGSFYGVVVEPWYWLVEKRLQVVARYQYARAEESEGIRLDSRYARERHNPPAVDLDGGYGDENHSFYLGLNYHLCGDNAKVMLGASYDIMSARSGDVKAATYIAAFRTYF